MITETLYRLPRQVIIFLLTLCLFACFKKDSPDNVAEISFDLDGEHISYKGMMGASGAGVGAQRILTPTPRHFFYAGEDPAIRPVPIRIVITIDSYSLTPGTYLKQISADINDVHYVQEPDDSITIVIESNKDGLVNGTFRGTLSAKPFGGPVVRK